MKKILLSLFGLLMAFSVSAKEVITDSQDLTFTGGWNWIGLAFYANGDPIKDEEAKTVDDSPVVYGDKSQFDYIIVNYESDIDVNLGVQYNLTGVIGEYGPDYVISSVSLPTATKGNIAALKLDKNAANKFSSVYMQNGNDAGTLKIKSIVFATADEYDDLMSGKITTAIWEGEHTFDGSWKAIQTPASAYASMKAGDAIIVTVAKVDNTINADWTYGPQVYIQGDWQNIYGPQSLTDGATDVKVKFLVTETELASIKAANEIEFGGMNAVISKVEIETGEALPEWEKEGKTLTLTLVDEEGKNKGNIKASEFNGYTDDAKVEFTFSCNNPSSYSGWGACSVASFDYAEDADGNVISGVQPLPAGKFGIKGETTTISCFLGDLKDALNYKSAAGTYGLHWNVWNFGSDCVNDIVDVKIYEMVGATGEKFVAQKDDQKVYLVGDVEDNDWNFSKGVEMAKMSDSKYIAEVNIVESWDGEGWFTLTSILGSEEDFAANNWENFNKNRYSVSADWGELNTPGTIAQNGDVSFKLAAGLYTITVDLDAMTIVIEQGATAINAVSSSSAAKTGKRLENGSVVIYKGGNKYNVAGSLIK